MISTLVLILFGCFDGMDFDAGIFGFFNPFFVFAMNFLGFWKGRTFGKWHYFY